MLSLAVLQLIVNVQAFGSGDCPSNCFCCVTFGHGSKDACSAGSGECSCNGCNCKTRANGGYCGADTNLAAAAAVAAPVLEATPTPPVFPDRWMSGETQTTNINGKPGPKSHVISYFDGPNNRTALTNMTGNVQWDVIVTDYAAGQSGKQYFIKVYGQGAKHPVARHCNYWCTPDVGPVVCNQADSLCSYDYNKKAKYFGTAEINGVETNKFFWGENLGPIPMNSLVLYTTQPSTTAAAMPVRLDRSVHPFGKALGNTSLLFDSWAPHPAAFDDAIFDLGPDAKYDCDSPVPSDDCAQAQAELRAWQNTVQQ